MPSLPPVPNCLKIELHYTLGADLGAINRLHFLYTGAAPTTANCNTLAAAILAAANSQLGPLINTQAVINQVVVQDLATNTGASGTAVGTTAGTRAGTIMPAGVSVLINLKIARRYRGGKPRVYFPGFVAGDQATQTQWANASLTAMNNAWANFVSNVTGQTAGTTVIAGQVNTSFYSGFTAVKNPTTGRYRNVPIIRAAPVVDAVASFAVSPKPASQRRRNRP